MRYLIHFLFDCFKILNKHYLNFVDAKKNYVSRHCRDKDYDVEKFDDIWLVGGVKLKKYRTVTVFD